MKTIRDFIISLFLIATIYFLFNYSNQIMQYVMIHVVYKDEVLDKKENVYFKQNNYSYVQLTDNYYPKNKQDILNLFYTALNKGYDELTFYCAVEYENCIDDVNEIASSETILSYINNYVSTFNSYNKIYININSFGRINVSINKIYSESDAKKINSKVDEVYNEIIKDNMSDLDKIKTVHDYIINNTAYDEERANQIKNNIANDEIHSSNTAFGPLFTGKAICGGYTDTMALFLDKMGIPNIKVSSKNHIWNAVYVDGKWLHLDLTWDDPVVINGDETLTYNYYLLNSEELTNKNDNQHDFDKNVFKELIKS
ncbi:MAG: transglutaminase domain-containing protein [Bacilli bacterium]|nr:transglutaminase domain-containing protein [Bacilli bacterium]